MSEAITARSTPRSIRCVAKLWRSVRAVKDANGVVSHYVMVFFEVDAPGRSFTADDAASPSSA